MFHLQIERSVIEFKTAVEYNPFDHVDSGINAFNFTIKANGIEGYLGVYLSGRLSFRCVGLNLYTKVIF